MSGLPYTNSKYSLRDISFSDSFQGSSGSGGFSSSLASMISTVSPILGIGMNFLSQYLQNQRAEEMYTKYQSPAAQMRQMVAAGINPQAAAQGISQSPPTAPPVASLSDADGSLGSLAQALGQSVNSSLTAENIAAQTRQVKELTRGQSLMNDYSTETFSERISQLKMVGLINQNQYRQGVELLSRYPEILSTQIEEMRSQIEKNDAQRKIFDEQINVMQKEIDKMEAEIAEKASQIEVNSALVGEINARRELEEFEQMLTQKKIALSALEVQKAELGADSSFELKYRQIEKDEGRESADKFLETQYSLLKKLNEAQADAMPLTVEQRQILSQSTEVISQVEDILDDIKTRLKDPDLSLSQRSSLFRDFNHYSSILSSARRSRYRNLRRLHTGSSGSFDVGKVGVGYRD